MRNIRKVLSYPKKVLRDKKKYNQLKYKLTTINIDSYKELLFFLNDLEYTDVLNNKMQFATINDFLIKHNLLRHMTAEKNWDTCIAFKCICNFIQKNELIIDAGSTIDESVILYWLYALGYQNLIGINLDIYGRHRKFPITYLNGDITNIKYQNDTVAGITCLSVLEHGVDVIKFLKESYRVLKKDGILIISIDYNQKKIQTSGIIEYGTYWNIFDEHEIREMIEFSKKLGFKLLGNIKYSNNQIVEWKKYNCKYTFLTLSLQKL